VISTRAKSMPIGGILFIQIFEIVNKISSSLKGEWISEEGNNSVMVSGG
jgi:hypothetical protein